MVYNNLNISSTYDLYKINRNIVIITFYILLGRYMSHFNENHIVQCPILSIYLFRFTIIHLTAYIIYM